MTTSGHSQCSLCSVIRFSEICVWQRMAILIWFETKLESIRWRVCTYLYTDKLNKSVRTHCDNIHHQVILCYELDNNFVCAKSGLSHTHDEMLIDKNRTRSISFCSLLSLVAYNSITSINFIIIQRTPTHPPYGIKQYRFYCIAIHGSLFFSFIIT